MQTKISFSILKTVFLVNYLLPLCIIVFAVISIKEWYPEIISLNNRFFTICILLVLIYTLYNTYYISKQIVNDRKLREELATLKRVNDGEIRLSEKMNFYLNLVEETKSKLELYKSISLIPILTFILGFIIKWDVNIFNKHLKALLNFELEFNYYVAGMLILFVIWYVISYRKCWIFYKGMLKDYYEVKTAYEELKINKNNNKQKTTP
ncbi:MULTISPECIES: hypothetical protein [Lysinibacillus]|uniref:hypothetical protein n=1 Tax=Lysinibacillus TaxID=400634 RepID=UPI00200C7D79|nr:MULTISPECIES: hypothetical protein [Lysinibacillus]MEB2280062.1 hypothetical protein [Lysinibacillus xylanilyticus]UPW82246.1 hypothetical protein MY533_16035 [Lysinibacillus sp. Ag94]